MDSALAQLVSGRVSAVGGNSQLLDGFSTRENRKLRVLWSSEPFFDLALMASPRVSPAQAQAVRDAFVGMKSDPAGRRVLENASKTVGMHETVGFVAADERDYANYVRFFENLPPNQR
jgi:phosphonate transport system substrate-binding protein